MKDEDNEIQIDQSFNAKKTTDKDRMAAESESEATDINKDQPVNSVSSKVSSQRREREREMREKERALLTYDLVLPALSYLSYRLSIHQLHSIQIIQSIIIHHPRHQPRRRRRIEQISTTLHHPLLPLLLLLLLLQVVPLISILIQSSSRTLHIPEEVYSLLNHSRQERF